ncbi:MAG: proton-conducting transporter membrane subunit [Betaproteobacteria bacterium]
MTGGESILAALAIPLVGAAAIAACGRRPNLREGATLLTSVLLFACVTALLPEVLGGGRPRLRLLELLPGLPLAFEVEPLGMLFALVASGLWIVNSLYSIGYMRANDEMHQTRFYVLFALALAATIGVAFAANLITLYLFYEMLTLVTYPLVTHAGTDEARRGGRVYLALLLGTSVLFLLPAIVFTWHVAGTTSFVSGGILDGRLAPLALALLLALFIFGIGKAALMPFHRWLPAAMVAPTPVSALLHAVAVVKAGVFAVVKILLYVFGLAALAGITDWLVGIAAFTIVAASVVALRADNLKRRLAYSTVSQLAYVVLATALLAPASVIGAVVHIAAHALGKITLFFAAGAIYTAAHKTEVSQLDGIGRSMPWTMGAFAVGALSMIGLPPAAGFVSKWYMLSGAMAQAHWFAVIIIIGSTLLNASYFLPIVHRAFFRPASPAAAGGAAHGEAPLPMVIALTLTAAGTIAFFFAPDLPLALARQTLVTP